MKKLKIVLLVLVLIFAAHGVMQTQEVQAKETSSKDVKDGLKKVKGSYYYYKSGKKVKKKWVTIKKNMYYFTKNGSAAIGWAKISDKAYYFNQKGIMQKSKKIEGIKLDKKGQASFKKERVQLKFQVIDIVKKQKSLKNCYNYVTKFKYRGAFESLTKADWEVTYALNALKQKSGNCYSYATAFAMLARECDYDAKIVTGTMSKDGDSERPHAWVEIDGKISDPQSENAMKLDFYGKLPSEISAITYQAKKRI